MRNYTKLVFYSFLLSIPLLACGSPSGNSQLKNTNMKSQVSLLEAVAKRDIHSVRSILEGNVNLEKSDSKGRTALMLAVYNEDDEIAEILIKAGADVNAQDNMLNSPFLYAGANGSLNILIMCLENHADFNVYNRYGGTALIPAAERGHLEVVKVLVNTPGYPIDHINNLGWTALLEAIILTKPGETQEAIVAQLIEAGADVNITDKDGVSPLKHAKTRSLYNVVQLLKETGAH